MRQTNFHVCSACFARFLIFIHTTGSLNDSMYCVKPARQRESIIVVDAFCVYDCLHCALSFTFHKLPLLSLYANCLASSLSQLRVTHRIFNYSTYDAKYV